MADYDFIKLTFDGTTTTELGLYVVNSGSRYTTPLTPTFENRTTSIPGRPGLIYWGTDLGVQEFSLSLATSKMTGTQLNKFKKAFVPGVLGKLSFEETFFKYYRAMITAPPVLSFIPFDEKGETIYKGEIELQLTTLDPYATSDLALGAGYTARASYKESGLPVLTDFPSNDGLIYHLGMGTRIVNRLPVTTKGSGTLFKIYHAGNAPAEVNFKFTQTYTLSAASGSIPPKVAGWEDLTIGAARLIKPRFLVDIEYALGLVYLSIANDWVNQKTNVLNILREELDGPARDKIVGLVNAATANNFTALYNAFVTAFFTGFVYTYSINGLSRQNQLTISKTDTTYIEDNSGAFNGKFITLQPSGILPVETGVQNLTSNRALANVEVSFSNTYI